MAGSPRALTPLTCKRPRHCWTRWRNATPAGTPLQCWTRAHNPLRVKCFHGLSAGNTRECSLKSRIGEASRLDIIANNPIDQKVVELCPSQHYSLVEHSMYRSVFPPQGVENGVFLPASPRASKAFADHDESDACGISAIARTFSVCLGSVCATTLC